MVTPPPTLERRPTGIRANRNLPTEEEACQYAMSDVPLFTPLSTREPLVTLHLMETEITFREYLEQRKSHDDAVRDFLAVRDTGILERHSWPDLMSAFQAEGVSSNYIWAARRFHQDYRQACARDSE
jgi:hypothetical protein